MVFVRTCHQGQVQSVFLAVDSPERANAEGIFATVTKALDECGVRDWQQRIVGFGSDGANVMVGQKGGVVAKLREIQPSVVGVHCFAHRLELAFKDVTKEFPHYTKMFTLLDGLYKFYSYSPLNRSNLKQAFESQKIHFCVPTRVGGTRWIPHMETALRNFWRGFPVIKLHLEQIPFQTGAKADCVGKAKGYLQIITNPGVLLFIMLMTDVVAVLAKLSLMVQNTDTTVAGIKTKIDSTTEILLKYKTQDGPKMRDKLVVAEMAGVSFASVEDQFNRRTRDTLITRLLQCLEARFSTALEGVIGSCRIADFRMWPDAENKEAFGNEEVQTLVAHFRPVLEHASVDTDVIELEWDLLKNLLYSENPEVSQLKWSAVFKSHKEDASNILALVDLIRTLPAHSADAERGFSEMKLVKTDWRSCLRPHILSDLLFVMFHTEEISKYDPTAAIHMWNSDSRRTRRPSQTPYGSRESSDLESDDPFTSLDPDVLNAEQ